MDDRQIATTIAALRYWQREGLQSAGHESDIATNEGSLDALSSEEIDALCESLNTDRVPSQITSPESAWQLVEAVAGLSIWSFSERDCAPIGRFHELPKDVLDSQMKLMFFIEEANQLVSDRQFNQRRKAFKTQATLPAALSEAPAHGDASEQTQQAGRLDGSELFSEEQSIVDIRSTRPTLLPHEQLNKSILFVALRAGGVKSATLTFQGGGDEGHIESVSYETEPGREFDDSVTVAVHAIRGVFENGQWDHTISLVQIPFESALEEFSWTVHERLHCGWENNEGGFAEMCFTVGPDGVDSIVVDHNDNYVESVNTVTTL